MSGYTYYNDNENYCVELLRAHVTLGNLPEGYIDERDIKRIHATDFVGYRHIHLFAGIGGFPLAMQWAGYPRHIRTLTGGFPCQDVSSAGKRAGITGERSGLWKEMLRLIQEADTCDMGFDYVLLENVAALVNRGLSTVLSDLAQAGYDAEWCCLRAADVGAPHQRERIFIMAYPHIERVSREEGSIAGGQRSATQPTGVCGWEDRTGAQGVAHLSSVGSNAWRTTSAQQQWRTDTVSDGTSDVANTSGARRRKVSRGPHGDEEKNERWTSQHDHQFSGHDQSRRTENVENATGRRERKHNPARGAEGTQCHAEQPGTGIIKSPICGVLDGLSSWVDRFRWPVGPDQPQEEWEPRRVISGRQKQRVSRLKALGNAIVPQLPMILVLHVMEHYREGGR